MPLRSLRRPRLRRRLAWQLVALFLAGALLPVALSDWLVIVVTGSVADQMDLGRRANAVHVASRQVYDRVQLAETLLRSLAGSGSGRRAMTVPAFDRLWCPAPGTEAAPSGRDDTDLLALWRRQPDAASKVTEHAQVVVSGEAPTRVLMAITSDSGAFCVGALAEDFLWEPLRNGTDDSIWTVQDRAGRTLVRLRGADAQEPAPQAGLHASSARLFLAGYGASQEWIFTAATPPARVEWHHLPIAAWLGAVAAITLLVVALVGQGSIRRALAPLQRLKAGTRQLARGDAAARVDVQRDDEIGELALAFNDMAGKLEEREAQLYRQAVRDDLTGLTNRFGLLRTLEDLLQGGAARRELAILFVDLDRFKDVNDRHGHATGDEVLRLAANRLHAIAQGCLLLARKGGDEFVVVVDTHDGPAQAEAIAGRIVAALAEPFVLAHGSHVCGASVGMALAPVHAFTAQELLRSADIALYEAKRLGRGRWVMFHPALDAEVQRRSDLLAALRVALEREQLSVHYQPRLDARSGRIESAEALVRWQRPGHGMVMPGSFIELAETAGLIEALGLQVLRQALQQAAQWLAAGLEIRKVSVNVSPRQFESGRLVAQVREALAQSGVAPTVLELEVTESLLSGEVADAHAQLAQLRALGVTVAIDDFGTGYSSMSMLRTLPIDVMKIDRAFVRDLEHDPNAVAIARTIVTLGRSLSLRLVAEGIETQGQADLLVAMGCDELQGFLFGPPMPAPELAAQPGLHRRVLARRDG